MLFDLVSINIIAPAKWQINILNVEFYKKIINNFPMENETYPTGKFL